MKKMMEEQNKAAMAEMEAKMAAERAENERLLKEKEDAIANNQGGDVEALQKELEAEKLRAQ